MNEAQNSGGHCLYLLLIDTRMLQMRKHRKLSLQQHELQISKKKKKNAEVTNTCLNLATSGSIRLGFSL